MQYEASERQGLIMDEAQRRQAEERNQLLKQVYAERAEQVKERQAIVQGRKDQMMVDREELELQLEEDKRRREAERIKGASRTREYRESLLEQIRQSRCV